MLWRVILLIALIVVSFPGSILPFAVVLTRQTESPALECGLDLGRAFAAELEGIKASLPEASLQEKCS